MGKKYGTTAGIFTSRVGYRVGDDVGGKYRKELLIHEHRETGLQRFMNRIVALLFLYLIGHIIYALWENL